jgi:hypothetical protein
MNFRFSFYISAKKKKRKKETTWILRGIAVPSWIVLGSTGIMTMLYSNGKHGCLPFIDNFCNFFQLYFAVFS